jgi:hypothetical protein
MSEATEATIKHIHRVQDIVGLFVAELTKQARVHDASKLCLPEREMFEEYTTKLKALSYGSPAYKEVMAEMKKKALGHHYDNNSHHPEHFPNGIEGMNLIDLVEMLCDWKAASERHDDGNIYSSIGLNEERFRISPQLSNILTNTAHAMGWWR